jgi:hypothetical protein
MNNYVGDMIAIAIFCGATVLLCLAAKFLFDR